MRQTRGWAKTAVVMGVFGLVGLLVATWLRPGVGSIDQNSQIAGDADVAALAVDEIPDRGVYALSIAEVTPDGSRTATVGAPLEGTFEIGSVSKPITGMLYADAVERGDASPETTLGEIFDLGAAEAGSVTLEELSQHRSGLPRLPWGLGTLVNSYRWMLLAQNPYTADPADVIEDVRTASVGAKDPAYSNLGFEALGHTLAESAETDYPNLVHTRLAEPLGLEALYVPAPGKIEADPLAVQGREASGRAQDAWDSSGLAPSGGIRADAASMAQLAEALLDGSAPGPNALEPTTDFDEENQIGAGWMVSEIDGREVTWHNGQTGGFFTWFGLDRERGTAIFISGATSEDLTAAGRALLRNAGEREGPGGSR